MADFLIRPYKKGDEININKSFNEVFGLNRTIEEWHWKFKPDIEDSRIMVAVDDQNEVLAHYAFTIVPMWIDGRVVLCGQTLDSFSIKRRDVLKNRVFLKLYEEFRDRYAVIGEFPFFYGCIGGRHLKLGAIALEYTEPVAIRYLYKESLLLLRPLGRVLGDKTWNWYLSRSQGIDLNAVDQLWESSRHRYKVSVVRDGEYINRRYLSHPVNQYMYLEIREDNQLSALAVLIYGDRLLKWVDLIWDGKNSGALRELESRIWTICQKIAAIKVELWLNNDEQVRDILMTCGMKTAPNPYDLYISSRSFDENLDGEEITRKFYFTMGDSDIV